MWTESHLGYANIIMGALIAMVIKLFFRKYDYNYFEILILLCFVMGFGMLISALFVLIQGLIHIDLKVISSIVAITYCSWAIGNFFEPRRPMIYTKVFLAYILGATSYLILSVILGNLIDAMLR